MDSMSETKTKCQVRKRANEKTLYCDVPTSLGAAEGLCLLVRHFLRRFKHGEVVFATELALRECLNNAIHHGNRQQAQRRIRLWVTVSRQGVSLKVADSGNGFNWRDYKDRPAPSSTTPSGRGLAIIGTYAKAVSFNRKGNLITVDIANQSARRNS
jgi:serine/threonine-protein kinase RsbW